MRALLTVFAAVLVTGCTSIHKAVPDDYAGEIARVSDSYDNKQSDMAHFYELSEVNGKSIATSKTNTQSINHGGGVEFVPYMITRKVLPQSQEFTIEAYRFFSADIDGNTDVDGKLGELEPVAVLQKRYVNNKPKASP